MFRLRSWKLLFSATGALSLGAFVLAGCATTASLTLNEPVAVSSADPSPIHSVQLSNADADIVIARAIAEHEMRNP
jgi:uncharacterized lipoprotein YajG